MTMGCVNAKPQHLPTSNPSSHTDGPTFDPTVSNQLLETIGEVGAAGNDNHSDQHSHTKRFSQDGVDANVSPKRHFGDETYVHNCRSSQGGQKLGSAEMAKRTDESGGDRPSGLFGYIFSGINDRRQRKSGGNLLLHSHFEGEQADNHVGNKLATTNEESQLATSSQTEEGTKKSSAGLAHFFHFGNHNGTLSTANNIHQNSNASTPGSQEKRKDKKEENYRSDDSRRPHGAPLSDQLHRNFQERLVTAQMSKTSLSGGKCLTESQRDFFRMLDDKIAQGNEDCQSQD